MPNMVSTILIDFRLPAVPSEADIMEQIVGPIESLMAGKFERIAATKFTYIFETVNDPSALLMVRIYEKGNVGCPMATVTLETPGKDSDLVKNMEDMDLEDTLKSTIGKKISGGAAGMYGYPTIRRCLETPPYLRSSDDRLLEYNFSEVLFSRQSDFQHVLIVDTPDFGRLLCLDYMTNLAESDTEAYTHAVMNLPHEDFGGKEVLILGGGDGALMKELMELENKPKFVTMVDIDDVVMDACTELMPSVAGHYMARDKRDGENYKVIAGDAIKFLKEKLSEGKKFDYVFGDLTDTPVATTARDNDIWNFLRSIISMGVDCLKPVTGRYLTHCNGKNVPEAHVAYEAMISSLAGGKCKFTRSECFVPSFLETWMYYQIWRTE